MGKINRYAPEVRDRAIRMVTDHRGEYPSQWAAIESVSQKLGMTPETLRAWVRRAEIDNGKRDGVTTAEAERIKALEKEVRELRRANEILKDASIFTAFELNGQPRKQCATSIPESRSGEFSRSAGYCSLLPLLIMPPRPVQLHLAACVTKP